MITTVSYEINGPVTYISTQESSTSLDQLQFLLHMQSQSVVHFLAVLEVSICGGVVADQAFNHFVVAPHVISTSHPCVTATGL